MSDPTIPGPSDARPQTRALLLGLVGVLAFSLSLPATRAAVADLDSTVVGLGRALVAAALAAGVLIIRRDRPPTVAQLRSLIVVAGGVVIGFPLLTSAALVSVPSAHGAVVVGLLPLSTAIAAVFRGGERPSLAFWMASLVGVAVVIALGITIGGGTLHLADLLLLGAVVAGGIGYAEGGRLAREMGGWRVVSWALIVAAPVLLVPVVLAAARAGLEASPSAWVGFAYISVVSMYLGFFAWYRALAEGGIARVGQLQLAQPVLTLVWSALLLGESIGLPTMLAAVGVIGTVAIGRRTRVDERRK
ncbi:MAG: DMT family transporter [Candidatus Limnocylindrales bacterium]